jgi:hypothetical protein
MLDEQQFSLPSDPQVAASPAQLGPGLKQIDGEPLQIQPVSIVHVAPQPSPDFEL